MGSGAKPQLGSLGRSFGLAALGVRCFFGLLREGRPAPITLEERVAGFPTAALPVRERAVVRWNRHQVPYVEASNDRDLAVALGGVHAHLRLSQIEMMRRISQGRVSEAVGPLAVPFDHALRLLDVGRAVPEIMRRLPAESAEWLDAFASGLNAYISGLKRAPYELSVLGIDPAPWNAEDLLRLSRLASADFTWKVWLRLIRLRERPDWTELWQRLSGTGAVPTPSYAGGTGVAAELDWLLGVFDRGGSNSVAVGGSRSAGGAPMIASDPHLSIMLPNLWLIAGCRSPGYNLVGLMIPGIPAFALGRNRWIAWGGTSLHAASSDLVDVRDLPPDDISVRREKIGVRWSASREIELRNTPHGPVISDAAPLGASVDRPLALRWIGHDATDELTALLRVNRARNWRDFRSALEGFAIPAQNMVYADAEGHIGQVMAARLPRRPVAPLTDIVSGREAAAHWENMVGTEDLPVRRNPPEGFVASSNNAPEPGEVAVGFFFSPDDRVSRARTLLRGAGTVTRDTLRDLQADVTMPGALSLRDSITELLREGGIGSGKLVEALAGWDGVYDSDSRGALAFEFTTCELISALHGPDNLPVYTATWDPWALLRRDLSEIERPRLVAAAVAAARIVERKLSRFRSWGDAHRLRLAHAFGFLPVFGKPFRYADLPWKGSNETLMKAAFGFSGGLHTVRMGANARHISDLSDPDENWFVLLGGQDGWLGSSTFLDQFELWRRHEMMRMPLRPASVERTFEYAVSLEPGPGER